MIKKCNKIIRLMKRHSVCLTRKALLTIYKSFVRPHLDFRDILYDKPENENFIKSAGKSPTQSLSNNNWCNTKTVKGFICRSSHQRSSMKTGVLKIFAKFKKHLCHVLSN